MSGFFQEDNGNLSSMRLMCFISLIAAIVYGFMTIKLSEHGAAPETGIYLTISFLVSAFAPKAAQKLIEVKKASQ